MDFPVVVTVEAVFSDGTEDLSGSGISTNLSPWPDAFRHENLMDS